MKKRSTAYTKWLHNFQVKVAQVNNNRTIITKWLKPILGRVKLNSDGCSKGNPGRSGGGSLLRSDSGMLIWAQADF